MTKNALISRAYETLTNLFAWKHNLHFHDFFLKMSPRTVICAAIINITYLSWEIKPPTNGETNEKCSDQKLCGSEIEWARYILSTFYRCSPYSTVIYGTLIHQGPRRVPLTNNGKSQNKYSYMGLQEVSSIKTSSAILCYNVLPFGYCIHTWQEGNEPIHYSTHDLLPVHFPYFNILEYIVVQFQEQWIQFGMFCILFVTTTFWHTVSIYFHFVCKRLNQFDKA